MEIFRKLALRPKCHRRVAHLAC